MRRRNFGVFNGLGHNLGLLTAHLLCLSALGSDMGILAPSGLPPRCLPATNLPQTLRLLAVRAGSGTVACTCDCIPCAGSFASAVDVLWRNNCAFSYPGSCPREVLAPKGKPGGNVSPFSSGHIKTRMRRLPGSLPVSRERDKERDGL